MISATTQTLAHLLSRELLTIGTEQISFAHPMVQPSQRPGLNVYCYHVQPHDSRLPESTVNKPCQRAENNHTINTKQDISSPESQMNQWMTLLFLISAIDHTSLGEQHLLSETLAVLSQYEFLPEEILMPELKGQGLLPIRVSNQEWEDTVKLWNVLCVPLRTALQVSITVPSSCHHRNALMNGLVF